MELPRLPIDDVLPELLERLRAAGNVVLRAPTGAGKTTRVPGALLDSGLAGAKRVVVLEPRRMAARAAARRVAHERGGAVGEETGWRVRFDDRSGPRTRILFVTDGVLLRRLQDDPFLEDVGCVVFDEFHERSLDADLALAMCRRVQLDARAGDGDPLRIVVMSATLQARPIADFLGDAPIVESEGRQFPVDVRYLSPAERARTRDADETLAIAAATERASAESAGHVLVFLPGVGEIQRTHAALESFAKRGRFELLDLYGDLSPEDQDRVLEPCERRKLILATNVAEASITIDGVTSVVDGGSSRKLVFDPSVGLDRLVLGPISKASADQRAGRAGRTAPGTCLRLWTEQEHRALPDEDEPEVRRVDVARALLELAAWGERDLAAFPWLEPPPPAAYARALELLTMLGALDTAGAITARGKRLARLPLAPRLARLLDEGARLGAADEAALAAALLSERDPFRRTQGRRLAAHESDSDVVDRVRALEDFERDRRLDTPIGELTRSGAFAVLAARDQFAAAVDGRARGPAPSLHEALGRALLAAFPDRLCRVRPEDPSRAVSATGRGVRLADECAVRSSELFVAVELRSMPVGEDLVRQASAVERAWLEEADVSRSVELEWDAARARVVAFARTRGHGLILEEAVAPVPRGEASEALLRAAAERDLERALGADRREVRDLRARVAFLAAALPELDWPRLDDDTLRSLLPALCSGRRSFEELSSAPLADALRGLLGHERLVALEREAPETLRGPSGRNLRVAYEPGRPPVLAARIQELFGLAQTPRVARGRVPVVLHLLAPNHRPQQVTDDLESFWNGAYHEVRKELRRRYPKHSWPEDPWKAQAERRPGRPRSG